MQNLQVFKNKKFGNIRVIEKDGEPWFVGKDVAEILGYQNTSKALTDHVDAEDKLNNDSLSSLGQRGGWIINESGLYSLILSSKLPQAKQFKRWVTSEVLPTIRKTGGYGSQISFKEQVECIGIVADILRVNDASKIMMLHELYKIYELPAKFLPKYEHNGSRQMKSLTVLLKENDYSISAVKFNVLLINQGYLEEKERPSSKGTKKFKCLTEKGLQYGENAVSPYNQKETQPLYYEDSFSMLYDSVLCQGIA